MTFWVSNANIQNKVKMVTFASSKKRAKMNTFPTDPFILFSWVNLKLRDFYPSLDALCDDLEINKEELVKKLADAGFEYNENANKFW